MNQGHKTWMAAAAIALCTNAAVAAQMPDDSASAGGPDASALTAFYGVSLATSPAGAVEGKAVWMAKVQGLIAQAPAWLQQNVLASKSKAEFAANLAILESMQKGTLESAASAVKTVAASSAKVTAQGVGPDRILSNNLVYTALSPCRIMDTRNASFASGVQGPIAGNVLKQLPGFITTGQNWGQYGGNAASDCGLNDLVGTSIYAVAIVITILNPNFSAYLGVSDSNSLPKVLSTVALNYTGGQGLSTMYIVPQLFGNTIYFAMPTGLSANIIFDVVGYFAAPQLTTLNCVSAVLGGIGSNNIANNSQYFLDNRAACPVGYTISSVACTYGPIPPAGLALIQVGPAADPTWEACAWRNQSGLTLNGTDFATHSTCCRLSGP